MHSAAPELFGRDGASLSAASPWKHPPHLADLQAAYDQAAVAPLAALAQRRPPQPATERHAQRIRQTIPAHADQILDDPAWAALATTLTDAETAGHDPTRLLHQQLTNAPSTTPDPPPKSSPGAFSVWPNALHRVLWPELRRPTAALRYVGASLP